LLLSNHNSSEIDFWDSRIAGEELQPKRLQRLLERSRRREVKPLTLEPLERETGSEEDLLLRLFNRMGKEADSN